MKLGLGSSSLMTKSSSSSSLSWLAVEEVVAECFDDDDDDVDAVPSNPRCFFFIIMFRSSNRVKNDVKLDVINVLIK